MQQTTTVKKIIHFTITALATCAVFFVFLLLNIPTTYAATITSTQTGDWHTGSTWVGGVAPDTGDTVNIASGHVVTFTSDIAEVVDINIEGTLTQNNANSQTISGDLTILSGGKLTHGNNHDTQAYIVDFTATNIDIQLGGSVDVDGLGYDGGPNRGDGYGPGTPPTQGYGEGNPNSNWDVGGGAHGGDGGDVSTKLGGVAYCDTNNPATMGSGGGDGWGSGGGDGGGLIILNAEDTFDVSGIITADGANGTGGGQGGGAGGGIKITASTITGTPTSFTFTGGDTIWGGGAGGGGGGGCAYIGYNNSNSISVYDASGGIGGTGVGDGVFTVVQLNQAPTVTAITPSQTAGSDNVTFTTTIADADSNETNLTVEY